MKVGPGKCRHCCTLKLSSDDSDIMLVGPCLQAESLECHILSGRGDREFLKSPARDVRISSRYHPVGWLQQKIDESN